MRAAAALAILLALAGCGEKKDGHRAKRLKIEGTAKADAAAPVTAPEAYRAYPEDVRLILYRADLLEQKCSGRFRGTRLAREAWCAEHDRLRDQLLAKGWCFGGADEAALQHWLPCAEDYPGAAGWIANARDEAPADQ